MTYNVTISGSGFVPLMQTANNIVDGWLGIGLLIMIWSVVFVLSQNYQTKRAAMAANFLVTIISVLFRYMKLINDFTMFFCFGLFLLTFIWLFIDRE